MIICSRRWSQDELTVFLVFFNHVFGIWKSELDKESWSLFLGPLTMIIYTTIWSQGGVFICIWNCVFCTWDCKFCIWDCVFCTWDCVFCIWEMGVYIYYLILASLVFNMNIILLLQFGSLGWMFHLSSQIQIQIISLSPIAMVLTWDWFPIQYDNDWCILLSVWFIELGVRHGWCIWYLMIASGGSLPGWRIMVEGIWCIWRCIWRYLVYLVFDDCIWR